MNLNIICIILVAHWISDFVLQTDKMALNKSTSNVWLFNHIAVYTAAMFAICFPIMKTNSALLFCVINGIAHAATDYFTSRWTSKLWKEGKRHEFFVVIGLDQLLHMIVLMVTLRYICH